jgi:hypothetical protein
VGRRRERERERERRREGGRDQETYVERDIVLCEESLAIGKSRAELRVHKEHTAELELRRRVHLQSGINESPGDRDQHAASASVSQSLLLLTKEGGGFDDGKEGRKCVRPSSLYIPKTHTTRDLR